MNEEALTRLIQQLMQPQSGGVMTDQDASRINNAYSPRAAAPTSNGVMTDKDANMLFGLLGQGNGFMPSSGDPDGMTAPPMQLSAEEIAARQAAYAQQEMLKQQEFLRSQRTGQQLQRGDDSLFDQMVRQRMGR
jgi:hypothetical protein